MKKLLMVMAVAVALVVPSMMRANSIIPILTALPTLDADGRDNIGGNADDNTWLWSYDLDLSGTSQAIPFTAVPGDVTGSAMSVLFDFQGFIGLPGGGLLGTDGIESVPAGWSVASFLTGPIAGQPEAFCGNTEPCGPDDPTLWNIVMGYGPGGATVPGPATFGTFVIRSSFGNVVTAVDSYFGQDQTKPNVIGQVTSQGNDGFYDGPSAPPEVPEPASLLLLGTGLLGLGSRLRKKNKKDNPSV